jgi:hypothetical protein
VHQISHGYPALSNIFSIFIKTSRVIHYILTKVNKMDKLQYLLKKGASRSIQTHGLNILEFSVLIPFYIYACFKFEILVIKDYHIFS